jgi:hypothetical protein
MYTHPTVPSHGHTQVHILLAQVYEQGQGERTVTQGLRLSMPPLPATQNGVAQIRGAPAFGQEPVWLPPQPHLQLSLAQALKAEWHTPPPPPTLSTDPGGNP